MSKSNKAVHEVGLKWLTWTLLFFLIVTCEGTHARLASDVAPVPKIRLIAVGVSNYLQLNQVGPPVPPPIPTAAADAKNFAAALEGLNGRSSLVSVTLLIDEAARRAAILESYHRALAQTNERDLLIFYFSGHTLKSQTSSGTQIIPYDAVVSPEDVRGIDLYRDLVRSTPRDLQVIFIADGCNIGASALGPPDEHPNVSVLSSTKDDELAVSESGFTEALSHIISKIDADLDGDHRLSLEELFVQTYPALVGTALRQHPTLFGLNAHRQYIATARTVEVSFEPLSQSDQPLHVKLASRATLGTISLNGRQLSPAEYRDDEEGLSFLSPDDSLVRGGFNLLTIGADRYHLWRTKRALQAFKEPYGNSYAVLVAIDDYDRSEDADGRGSTGFPEVSDMVSQTEKLASLLKELGFPHEQIIKLYNGEATSHGIEDVLKTFWKGGSRSTADRLFFYFGGHGDELDKQSRLITYDYDPNKPLLTTFDSSELLSRHAKNIAASHVLFALDACFTGLAFLGAQERGTEGEDVDEFKVLARIERNISQTSRAILVAATGDQKALWQNGGVFTQGLFDGLSGKADTNRDGLIEFDEIGLYVRDKVTSVAREKGIKQYPDFRILDEFGSGRFMFFRKTDGVQR
ncbi:caspase family protein [Rhizobium leguminosarum]|uniref:caspase family protein n=1 Tax=Rhizobium leguminosarum TaxID=384 RepID=UPI001C960CD7|nr:caspase family protein [Rhizobium leguminosarum]MBY5608732.1 caspase family protein [Rhizobium leguminosarum]MBY5657305.1 caspase family protein [Rhizobium leguminosarum]